MDDMIYLFAAVVFLAAVLASISIWAPRKLWTRGASVIATAGLIIVSYIGFSDLLSILSAWGTSGGAEDVDGDGTVGFSDLLAILSQWGDCAP